MMDFETYTKTWLTCAAVLALAGGAVVLLRVAISRRSIRKRAEVGR